MQPAGKRNKAFPFEKWLDWDSSCRFNVLNSYRKEKQKKKKKKKEATDCALRSLQTNLCEVSENYENIPTQSLGPCCLMT